MRLVAITTIVAIAGFVPKLSAGDIDGLEFYEKKIRPVLAEHCFKCHSRKAQKAGKLKGGLILESREMMLTGGDSGPAIRPGKPKESLLLKTLDHDGETRMPPSGKLSDAILADFAKWIEMGAPVPAESVEVRRQTGLNLDEGRKFWSYQPVTKPSIPIVKDTQWPAGDIDRFVLAALEAGNLTPAPEADKAVLIRRLSFDLTGLPPSPDEVATFASDESPKAYEDLVDRLLAMPGFGERWGRHWLDVARFAESTTLRGFIFKEGWRYRDYVIQSFNGDVPFNRFIREQIAGDLLPSTDPLVRQRQMIAATFLMLGNTNLEEQDKRLLRMDVVDEQLDVITKGFLAQTVTCARCHDHKFDPIPTRDYYAMAGILRNTKSLEHANVSKWIELPLPTDDATEAALAANEKKIKALQVKLAAEKKKAGVAVRSIVALKDVPGIAVDDANAKIVGDWKRSQHSGSYVGEGYLSDNNNEKGEKTVTFEVEIPASGKYEVRLAYSPAASRADKVPVTVFSADGERTVTVNMQAAPSHGHFTSLGSYRFEKGGQSFVIVSNEGTKGYVTPDCVTFIPADTADAVRPARPAGDVSALEAELKELLAQTPKRPMAMVPVDEGVIEEAQVHIRGSVSNLGETVPRGVLTVAITSKVPSFPKNASGRVELADWIASDYNPLTARVIVNRVWHWLFGTGIVRTVDNFGTTGETPCNAALLDHLAARFVAEGWSIKKLVRELVLSRTYRQSTVNAAAVKADPENRLFGHANRKRLDAECIRDTMLVVSGRLSQKRFGPTFPPTLAADYNYKTNDTRRSVYLPVFRNSLPDIFEVFDFAEPSMVVGVRNTSTVAPQALYFLNNSFVIEQSKYAATRILHERRTDDTRLERAYCLALGRGPAAGERAVAMKYLAKGSSEDAWTAIFHALIASADFRYLN